MTDMFLSKGDVAILKGIKIRSKQIAQLRRIGLPFWVNALGVPVVPRSAIEGTVAEARREVKLLHQNVDVWLHGLPQHHVDAYREDVERCTGLQWRAS